MPLPFLDSLAGRTMVVLLFGLTLSHVASTALLSHDRHDAVAAASARLCAERVAAIARLLDRNPVEARAALAADLASPTLHIALDAAPPPVHGDGRDGPVVAEAFRATLGPVASDRLRVHHHDLVPSDNPLWLAVLHGFPRDQTMEVSFRLADGGWVRFTLAMARGTAWWSPRAVASLLVMIAGIIALGWWATRWISRPLATFVAAAERLGGDVEGPPLAETGPREVRQAVAAFNRMQDRIRRFIADRTLMLAAISHDLRSPITRLRLRVELLADDAPRRRMLADLAEMEAMVASALDFARGGADDEPTRTIDLAATLATLCDDAADLGLDARYRWEGRLLCAARPVALKRALANLVENAARYGERARVTARSTPAGLEVVVEDDGPGLAPAELERVFTPFYRLDGSRSRKTGGVGLGMTVARSIIRAHGGEIRLETRAEGGLRAVVTLPQPVPAGRGGEGGR